MHPTFVFVIGLIGVFLSKFTDHIKGFPDKFLLDCLQTAVLLKHFSGYIEWQGVRINKTLIIVKTSIW